MVHTSINPTHLNGNTVTWLHYITWYFIIPNYLLQINIFTSNESTSQNLKIFFWNCMFRLLYLSHIDGINTENISHAAKIFRLWRNSKIQQLVDVTKLKFVYYTYLYSMDHSREFLAARCDIIEVMKFRIICYI